MNIEEARQNLYQEYVSQCEAALEVNRDYLGGKGSVALSLFNQYLKQFEDNHDDMADIDNHMVAVLTLLKQISQVRNAWQIHIDKLEKLYQNEKNPG